MVELLAPAGDIEKIIFAFNYGADAVYFGGTDYSLRANAKNFSLDDIKNATLYAHNINKKVYVTVNIVFHDDDTTGLEDYLLYLDSIEVDGIIASDILVMKKIQELGIKAKLIVSTQASVLNYETAKFYQKLGAKQIVLAREAMKEDIKRIKDVTGLEIETFIHGAMCTSFSGKCVMSNYMTNRDSNRGGCAQICRWVFNKDDKCPFTMSTKDLNFINEIGELISLGVNTFKIEGRMRSIYYISTVLYCYRNIIDKYLDGTITENDKSYYLKILNRVANRDSSPQFLNNIPGYNEQYYSLDDEVSNQDFLGIVLDYDEQTKIATIEQRNYFKVGDKIEIFGPSTPAFTYTIESIMDEEGNLIDIANKPRMIVKLKVEKKLYKYDLLRLNLGIK